MLSDGGLSAGRLASAGRRWEWCGSCGHGTIEEEERSRGAANGFIRELITLVGDVRKPGAAMVFWKRPPECRSPSHRRVRPTFLSRGAAVQE